MTLWRGARPRRRPAPFGVQRWTLRLLSLLLFALTVWAAFAKIDVVAVAEGKLVPRSYLKIVQPSDAGIVREILIGDGQHVAAGQVLMRLDPRLSESDLRTLGAEAEVVALQLRRIDAELADKPLQLDPRGSAVLASQVHSQYLANRSALSAALAQEQAVLEKAQGELAAALAVRRKLQETLPYFRNEETVYGHLAATGYAAPLVADEKRRLRIEREQDLKAQDETIRAIQATEMEAQHRSARVRSDYRRQLETERAELTKLNERARNELAKQAVRHAQLELRAPAGGIVKDLAVHTPGAVVSPGTVLASLVPDDEELKAEIWVTSLDVGFVKPGQTAKVKLAAFPFDKYGLIAGRVEQISPDATDRTQVNASPGSGGALAPPAGSAGNLAFRALVSLDRQQVDVDGVPTQLSAGMQVSAEIRQRDRTVLEYLISPVQRATSEAGKER